MKQTIVSAEQASWFVAQVSTPLVDKILKKVSATAKAGNGSLSFLTKRLTHAEIYKAHDILTARGFKVTYTPARKLNPKVPFAKYAGPYRMFVRWVN